MTVRVRFAPSPTGTLHIGSARTALFNWLFARHSNGTLILRIEDTDQKRSKPEFVDDIRESLRYLGIDADEGPFHQSQRLDLYRRYAQQLLDAGKAVKQDGAVMFQVPPKPVTFTDVIHGDITVDTSLFESLVLMKSDGLPTYNFACVVDDASMHITHVIRELATRAGVLVTIEESQIAGGFGSAVSEALDEMGLATIPLSRIGLPDQFVEHGKRGELLARTQLDPASLERRIAMWHASIKTSRSEARFTAEPAP